MSAAPKFTPGPWSVEDVGANCLRIRGNVEISPDAPLGSVGHYEAVAAVIQREPHPHYGGGIDYDTRDANARLIASAPDLYARGARLADVAEAYARRGDDAVPERLRNVTDADLADAIYDFRAALAKAEGASALPYMVRK